MVQKESDILVGMKALRQMLCDVSEATILKWYRESNLPIKKRGGVWTGSRKNIEKWWMEFSK